MRILSLIIASLITGVSYGQSQKFTFKLGSEYELPRKTQDLAFFGNEKDGIVNLSIKKDELNIVRFNVNSLKKTFEQKTDLTSATKNFLSELVVGFNDKDYYWLHSDWDKSTETETLYYDKVDVGTGKITVSNKKILESTKVAGTATPSGFYSYKTVDKYQYEHDAAYTKLLVTYRLAPEFKSDKKNYDKIGFHVFDEKMNKLWGKEFTMPYTEAVMDNSNFSVDGDGNAYMLVKVYDNDSRRERDKSTGAPAYRFEVFKFTKNSKKIIIAPVVINDNYIKETTLTESSQHEMIVACTYSKKVKNGGTDGVFLAVLDQSGKLVKYKNGSYEFPKEELQKFESAKIRRKIEKKDDYEVPNLKVRKVIIEKDGGIFIGCEEYKVVVNSYTSSNGTTRTTTTYFYEDMLGCKIDASGKFEWLRKIPKKQRGTGGRGTMSFKLISDDSGYYFLYLDNLKNLKITEDEEPKYHVDGYGGQVVVSTLTKKGELSKELLFDTREEKIMIFPAQFDRISGNKFIGRARLTKSLYKPLVIEMK